MLCLFACSRDEAYHAIPKGLNVLWLGTSIPEGCQYPKEACKEIDANCINMSKGASFLAKQSIEQKGILYAGLSLTASDSEKEFMYGTALEKGEISKEQMQIFRESGFEQRVLPYIDMADVVVIDHGYNDGNIIPDLYKNREHISDNDTIWNSVDKTNFIGAFNFLYKTIKERKPDVKIIIGGYFQNQCSVSYSILGKYVARVSEDIARHYNIPLLDVWNYTNIKDGYIEGSENYLDSINNIYGTSFKKWNPNAKGEITYFQKFCPDAVHPFTDPTGESQKVLNRVFKTLFPQKIKEAYYIMN